MAAATIDGISDGRFVLGLGAGWQINEHHAYGIDLLPPGARVTRFGGLEWGTGVHRNPVSPEEAARALRG